MSQNGNDDGGRRAEEFLGIFSKGAAFTKELLDENERLRMRLVDMKRTGDGPPLS